METQSSGRKAANANGYHIVVKNLANCTTETDIRNLFSNFGARYVEIHRKRSKGAQAFVMFMNVSSASAAFDILSTRNIRLHAKQLKLDYTDYYKKIKTEIAPPFVMMNGDDIYNILPIEIIAKIIGYLPYRDQARLERVSKLWRMASLSTHSTVKHFKIDKRWPSGWHGVELSRKCFYWLINRVKTYTWTLQLSECTVLSDMSELLEVIIKSCPNLHAVDLREVLFLPEMGKDLYSIAPRLTELTIGPSDGLVEPELIKILKEAKKLVKFRMIYTIVTGKLLTYLNPNLEILIVQHCHHVKSSHMCEAIERLQNLKHLEITACPKLDDSVLRALINNTNISKTIETLKFSYFPNPIPNYDGEGFPHFEYQEVYMKCKADFTLPGILFIKRYTNIKSLALRFCGWVTEEVLYEITDTLPQLEYLDLSGCTNIIGSFALDPLAKLENITTLKLNHLHSTVDGSVLNEFKKLKVISCRNSLGFDNKAICAAITNCPYLSTITIEDCLVIGKPVILCALSTIRNNNRTSPLTIHVADSGISKDMKFPQNDLLRICYERLHNFSYKASIPYKSKRVCLIDY
ncbi:Putative RNA-binding protein EEED8.10 [Melipona quadrifasciata]|uniref:Putative RNA-binding protein EEED8.10 n=1 Tax=Melipona quadrifasciata TaxID=166423 RepID=A0A0N1ITQ2_9HYME|nr:Putative RNA-binding protein EEED8.10 [Melipona quadrifasciata]